MPDLSPAARYWLRMNDRLGVDLDAIVAKAETVAHKDGRALVCRNDLDVALMQVQRDPH